jgi:hypothetical protein
MMAACNKTSLPSNGGMHHDKTKQVAENGKEGRQEGRKESSKKRKEAQNKGRPVGCSTNRILIFLVITSARQLSGDETKMPKKSPLKAGETVTLHSGGHLMAILSIDCKGVRRACQSGTALKKRPFPPSPLTVQRRSKRYS